MRGRCGALIAAAVLAAAASPVAAAAPGPRAAILFVPGPVLDQPGLSLGLTSPTLGGYKRPQFALDLSQGARISTRAYTRGLAPLALAVAGGRGQVAGWDSVVVVQAPPRKPLTLLYTGAAGPGISGRGVIRSATTRRDGYIAAPDISATVLRTLGIKVPKKMQGERIESRSGQGAAYVRDL